jgi:hypothetical protein
MTNHSNLNQASVFCLLFAIPYNGRLFEMLNQLVFKYLNIDDPLA